MFSQIKDIKHIKWDFHFGVEFLGAGGAQGSIFFFEHGHIACQIDGGDRHNRMQVKLLPYGQTGGLGVWSKGQTSLNFSYKVNFKDFMPNF